MFTYHQAMFYRLGNVGSLRYDLRYKITADYDLTLRFLKFQKTYRLPAKPCLYFRDVRHFSNSS